MRMIMRMFQLATGDRCKIRCYSSPKHG